MRRSSQPPTSSLRSPSTPTTTVPQRRLSPPMQMSDAGRPPPAKRARKAINCEPCRASKLKCDRSRPCSSCVLRGTAAGCYPDGQEHANMMKSEEVISRIDPQLEIARMRQSLQSLEAHLGYVSPVVPPTPTIAPSSPVKIEDSPIHPTTPELRPKAIPGVLERHKNGTLFAGPTSAASHLIGLKSTNGNNEDSVMATGGSSSREQTPEGTSHRDTDLLNKLPSVATCDQLVHHYFAYCNWMYRSLNYDGFLHCWEKFRAGHATDRVTLATICILMAIAVQYLPPDHGVLQNLDVHNRFDAEAVSDHYYSIGMAALKRYKEENRPPCLDLIECEVLRGNYLAISKTHPEEIWSLRGELISAGTAMGLHRDPAKWGMPHELAERRRFAWWNIILLERWQAFMFGRPIAIATHHWDTSLPSGSDPHAAEQPNRIAEPNLHLFRLAQLLGDIVDDALSVRAVSYDRILHHDKELLRWQETMPSEMDLDEYKIARSLASSDDATRRAGVVSVCIRTAFHNIRFTLHRPYAMENPPEARMSKSKEIAVAEADRLVTLVSTARPEFVANLQLAVPGHLHWGPFHVFSAATFLSFQLIANPDQPGASLFRKNINRTLKILEGARGAAVADKGLEVLLALRSIYDDPDGNSSSGNSGGDREMRKAQVMAVVKRLSFPYHGAAQHTRSSGGSRRSASGESPRLNSPLQPRPPPPPPTSAPPPPSTHQQQHNSGSHVPSSHTPIATHPPQLPRHTSATHVPQQVSYTHPPPAPPPPHHPHHHQQQQQQQSMYAAVPSPPNYSTPQFVSYPHMPYAGYDTGMGYSQSENDFWVAAPQVGLEPQMWQQLLSATGTLGQPQS